MKTPISAYANAAAPGSAPEITNELPTVAGAVPPAFAHQFQSAPAPAVPEFSRLPKPRDRCPISGGSRTWLIEHDAYGHYLFRARQRGKMRGAVFVNVAKLLGYLRKIEAQSSEGGANLK